MLAGSSDNRPDPRPKYSTGSCAPTFRKLQPRRSNVDALTQAARGYECGAALWRGFSWSRTGPGLRRTRTAKCPLRPLKPRQHRSEMNRGSEKRGRRLLRRPRMLRTARSTRQPVIRPWRRATAWVLLADCDSPIAAGDRVWRADGLHDRVAHPCRTVSADEHRCTSSSHHPRPVGWNRERDGACRDVGRCAGGRCYRRCCCCRRRRHRGRSRSFQRLLCGLRCRSGTRYSRGERGDRC